MPCVCLASAHGRKASGSSSLAHSLPSVLQAYGASDKGRVRPVNEDFWAFEPSCGLCVVADGMGGHKAGDIASRLAVDAIVGFMKDGDGGTWPFGFDPALSAVGNRLRTAVHLAHMHILEI